MNDKFRTFSGNILVSVVIIVSIILCICTLFSICRFQRNGFCNCCIAEIKRFTVQRPPAEHRSIIFRLGTWFREFLTRYHKHTGICKIIPTIQIKCDEYFFDCIQSDRIFSVRRRNVEINQRARLKKNSVIRRRCTPARQLVIICVVIIEAGRCFIPFLRHTHIISAYFSKIAFIPILNISDSNAFGILHVKTQVV